MGYRTAPSKVNRNGFRALDIDADLSAHKEEVYALVEKIRKLAKKGDKRIKYIIYDGKIMSPILGWKRRKYNGANPHRSHFHISFTSLSISSCLFFSFANGLAYKNLV